MGLVDHRDLVNWEKFEELLGEAILRGYTKGLQDFRDNNVSFESINEVHETIMEDVREHYYE